LLFLGAFLAFAAGFTVPLAALRAVLAGFASISSESNRGGKGREGDGKGSYNGFHDVVSD
jgi:hypothetical protein